MAHEEVMSIGYRRGIPAAYIYAVNQETLAFLRQRYRQINTVLEDELTLADNVAVPLDGTDLIGVWLEYDDKRVCYFNDYPNRGLVGTSATYMQVAVGVLAGLRAALHQQIPSGVNYPEDLASPVFAETMHTLMRVGRRVFAPRQSPSTTLVQS